MPVCMCMFVCVCECVSIARVCMCSRVFARVRVFFMGVCLIFNECFFDVFVCLV